MLGVFHANKRSGATSPSRAPSPSPFPGGGGAPKKTAAGGGGGGGGGSAVASLAVGLNKPVAGAGGGGGGGGGEKSSVASALATLAAGGAGRSLGGAGRGFGGGLAASGKPPSGITLSQFATLKVRASRSRQNVDKREFYHCQFTFPGRLLNDYLFIKLRSAWFVL